MQILTAVKGLTRVNGTLFKLLEYIPLLEYCHYHNIDTYFEIIFYKPNSNNK